MPIWFWIAAGLALAIMVFIIIKSGEYYGETRVAAEKINNTNEKTPAEVWQMIQWYSNVTGARDHAIFKGADEKEMAEMDAEWEKAKRELQAAIGYEEAPASLKFGGAYKRGRQIR